MFCHLKWAESSKDRHIYKYFVPTGLFVSINPRLHSGAGVAAGVAPGRVRASGRG